jgi:hypothetical protein
MSYGNAVMCRADSVQNALCKAKDKSNSANFHRNIPCVTRVSILLEFGSESKEFSKL